MLCVFLLCLLWAILNQFVVCIFSLSLLRNHCEFHDVKRSCCLGLAVCAWASHINILDNPYIPCYNYFARLWFYSHFWHYSSFFFFFFCPCAFSVHRFCFLSICMLYNTCYSFRTCWELELHFLLLLWRVIYCNCWRRMMFLLFVGKRALGRQLRWRFIFSLLWCMLLLLSLYFSLCSHGALFRALARLLLLFSNSPSLS